MQDLNCHVSVQVNVYTNSAFLFIDTSIWDLPADICKEWLSPDNENNLV